MKRGLRTSAASALAEAAEQGDLFVCELANWPLKDDIASMEIPLFSLSKNPDTRTREWHRGNRTLRVIPSSVGAATVFDKDLLLYCASQIVEALNLGKPVSKKLQIDSHDFLIKTERHDGRESYENIIGMLRRLRGTTIETNIPTGDHVQTRGFALIDNYEILAEKKRRGRKIDPESGKVSQTDITRVLSFTVTLSDWLYNGLLKFEVLTLDRGYFLLGRPIERRLYEIARKHCGDQSYWKVGIDLLAEKVGTNQPRYKFRNELREVIAADSLPDYRIGLDPTKSPDDVVFFTRDSGRLSRSLTQDVALLKWFMALERQESKRPGRAIV